MPGVFKLDKLMVKDPDGKRHGINGFAERTLSEMIAELNAAGKEVRDSIPEDYTELTENVEKVEDQIKDIVKRPFASEANENTSFLVSENNSESFEELKRLTANQIIALIKNMGRLVNRDDINAMEIVANVERTDTGLCVTWLNGQQEDFTVASEGGGLSFDGGYQDEEGYLYLTKDGEEIEGFDPIKIVGGGGSGGGGGSKITFACYTSPTFSVMESSGTAQIRFKFASVDTETGVSTGSGNLAISVGGIVRQNMTISQGDDVAIDIFQHLQNGSNAVKLTITDSYGATATRNFTVTMENFGLEWSLGSTYKNTDPYLSYYITPTGSGKKTIYTYLDGKLYATDIVSTSGRRLTKTISGLSHGMHTIEVYGLMDVGGASLESAHLVSAVAQINNAATPVIAVNWPTGELAQYTNVAIPFMVIDPANNPSEVSLYINGVMQSSERYDQSEQVWSYRPVMSGAVKLGIKCGSVLVEKTLTVTSIGAEIDEITDGLAIKVDPSTITSLKDWRYGEYGFSLSPNFDLTNGGLQVDDKGVHCIRITAGDRLTLNYPLFSGDARRTGKAFKVVYKVANSSNKEAEAIRCVSGGIGFTAKANNVYLSGDQTTVKMSVCEDEKTELDVNIQQDSADKLLYLWEQCSTFVYGQYAANESFTHTADTGITFGSDDADVYLYLFRAYNRDLTEDEIKANYIFDGADGTEIISRQDRNDIYDGSGRINVELVAAKNPNVHFITINAPRMTVGKKDTVVGSISHICVSGGSEHRFTAPVEMVIQGTSSVEHAETAGGNLKFKLKEGITLEDGTHRDGYAMHGEELSIPISVLNYKKNIASEDHIVNMMCAEYYQKFQPTVRQKRVDDPRVRDCLEAVMCAVFFHNTGTTAVKVGPDTVEPDETVFFGLGNLCTDKDAAEAFQYDPIVIEVKNNTEPQVRFKSDDLSGDGFDNNFEFRYLDEDVYTEDEAKALFQELLTFVHSCDYTEATNTLLERVAIIDGQAFSNDTEAYRKAKWKAYAPDHFDMAGLYWHHNHTLFHLLRDNRAKNMFWSYSPEEGKWSLRYNWDNDTGHCRNNEGYIDIEPGYLDFDTVGTADVFNGADNVVFCNLRECNWEELKASYINRESVGAWNTGEIYDYCQKNQSDICEALWIEDAKHNAIRTMQNLGTTAYLERATGKLRLHLKKSLMFQKALVDSYYCSTAATSDSSSFRGYTPASWAGVAPSGLLKITPYTDMFINILAGSTAYRQRAYAGQETEIDLSAALNDTEIYLRNAGWIMSLGSMAGMYLGQFEASKLKRVKTLLIGSDVEGYYNTNFTTASFDNCLKLQEVNLGGLVNAKKAFDFSPNIYLQKIYTKGSGVTGITFAKNGRLKEAHLNALSALEMSGLRMMDIFDMEDYSLLTSISIEDSPAVQSFELVEAARNLARVRLLEIDWDVPVRAYDILLRLKGLHGIDDDGYDVDGGIVTGKVHFRSITRSKYEELVEKMPALQITYGELLEEVTVTFTNDDGTVLWTAKTEKGGSITDPIAAEYIPVPQKASTVESEFVFYGWDARLDFIADHTTIKATYMENTRTYTVRFINHDNEVLESHTIEAHGSVRYEGKDISRTGYIWTGWDADTSDVKADMDVHAVFLYPTLPASVKDVSDYEFAYSDDPEDSSAYTFGELYAIMKTGRTAQYLPIKAKIKMLIHTSLITDEYMIFNLHSVGHYALADGSGMSNADWYMSHVLIAGHRMNPTNTNVGGWDACEMRGWLNNDIYKEFPSHWRQMISLSITKASAGNMSATIVDSEDYLRLPSHAEMGWDINSVPYKNEVDTRAKEVVFSQYTDNPSRVKKNYYGEGTNRDYWLRSAEAGGASAFRGVYNFGTNSNYGAAADDGVCVGFSV